MTTRPPNGIPASRSLRWKKIASSTGSWRGEVTIRNVVAGSASSAPTRSARATNAVDHAAERAEEHRQVLQQVDAGHAPQQPERHARAAADDAAPEPGGAQEDLDRAALEEAGEPGRRVEEVERVARRRRVEHEQVEVAALVEVVELGDRRELLRAGHRARELLVDPVARAPRRASRRSGARRSMSSSNVRLASSISAHSSPRISTPCSVKRAGSMRCGSLPSSASPSELASRRAGSIVTTATFAPSAAAPMPSAAAVVVLPTPPEPAHTTTRLPAISSATELSAIPRRSRHHAGRAGPRRSRCRATSLPRPLGYHSAAFGKTRGSGAARTRAASPYLWLATRGPPPWLLPPDAGCLP